ncbi:hypothetical protein COHA_001568 [Chlorella ohadii]|uniref:Uncharacterized protein n=1 Tax=Chlorella ohadii TaxID=2649997 RepID=A0AAD5DZ33_9CHLO|nr:hypothetical protein COHA_001568 [Chlorella ohadii]
MSGWSSWFEGILNWLRSLFFHKEMELSLIGLQNAGKTSLVNVLTTGQFHEDMIPTVGFNMRKVSKGGVTIKLWDLGGQARFRSMWERYCRGVQAIVFVVDSADLDSLAIVVDSADLDSLVGACFAMSCVACFFCIPAEQPGVVDSADLDSLDAAKEELQGLLGKPSLASIPLLVLGNKNDLPEALSANELIARLGLKEVGGREVCVYSISCKSSSNIDVTLKWLQAHAK